MVLSLSSLTRNGRRARPRTTYDDHLADSHTEETATIPDAPGAPSTGHSGYGDTANAPQYRPPFEIEPYELYIRLAYLKAGWPDAGEWPPGVVIACGFQSIELLMILAHETMTDDRLSAQSNGRLERIVEVMANTFLGMGKALAGSTLPESARTDYAPRYDSSMEAVARLMPSHHQMHLKNAFTEAFGTLGYRFGIEHVFTREPCRSVPCLDYAAFAAPDRMIELQSRHLYGTEDRLFGTVHQVVECWLNVVHLQLRLALELGKQGDWRSAAIYTRRASSGVAMATQVCRLLDTMVLRDYHLLRVPLRDGSGAQSMTARALPTAGGQVHDALDHAIKAASLTLMSVLDEPDKYVDFHDQQTALQDFGRRCQTFLFEHYLLAISVHGVDSLGGLGFPIHTLAKRAAQPLFRMANQVKYDYAIITGFRYARRAGAIILDNELRANPSAYADPPELKSADCPADVIRHVSRDYFTFIENRDVTGWMSLFHPEGWLLDAPEARPFKGPDRLRVFIESMFNMLIDMRVTDFHIAIGKNSADIDWSFTALSLGVPLSYSGRETLRFANDGRILQAIVHYDAAELGAQLWRGKNS